MQNPTEYRGPTIQLSPIFEGSDGRPSVMFWTEKTRGSVMGILQYHEDSGWILAQRHPWTEYDIPDYIIEQAPVAADVQYPNGIGSHYNPSHPLGHPQSRDLP
jgi:hypothetical protein